MVLWDGQGYPEIFSPENILIFYCRNLMRDSKSLCLLGELQDGLLVGKGHLVVFLNKIITTLLQTFISFIYSTKIS